MSAYFTILLLSIVQFVSNYEHNIVPKAGAFPPRELNGRPLAVGTFVFMEKERWKAITGYDGLYAASNLGRIKSLRRVIIRCNGHPQTIKSRILSPGKLKASYGHGYYLIVMLCDHGVDRMFQIQRLIATEWCKKPKGCNEVNHLNEIKHDNRAVNLEWVNHHENNTYRKKRRSSAYTGVHADPERKGLWRSVITVPGGGSIYLGRYRTPELAAAAYDKAFKKRGIPNRYRS